MSCRNARLFTAPLRLSCKRFPLKLREADQKNWSFSPLEDNSRATSPNMFVGRLFEIRTKLAIAIAKVAGKTLPSDLTLMANAKPGSCYQTYSATPTNGSLEALSPLTETAPSDSSTCVLIRAMENTKRPNKGLASKSAMV